ncbi:bifunctional glycosyltransferase/CDP-glycerol:glycerophosphate glycerophosphotransferase [Priestia megaterium]|uniref:bifunctional glycosyltransferase/CDP-glycerol:glycerophosphate glycerophosphotransferase n=1 Tax=Priestia megaterium TaxID=1404 RepID=UPI0034D7B29D
MNNLISVVIPMHNTETYLEKTLKTVVNQTYQNIEIILVDDASTDETLTIAETYANQYSNIKLIKQIVNQGVSAARNAALKVAKGDYITFVDSDDLLTKEALSILHANAVEHNADLVLGVYKHFSSKGTRLGSLYKRFKSFTKKGRLFSFTNPEIFSHMYIFGKLYKKELIEKIEFPKEVHYGEDQPFTMYAYLHAKNIVTAPSVVYYYRERDTEGSATQLALKHPSENLQSLLNSFDIGRRYFKGPFLGTDGYALLLYISRVVEGSIRFLFEGAILSDNQVVLYNSINILKKWLEELEPFLIAGTDSFQRVFFDNGEVYMKYLDVENQKLYLQLLRLIKDKKISGNFDYNQWISNKNMLLEMFLKSIDEILRTNNIVKDNNYSVCYPVVSSYNEFEREATVHFQLLEGDNSSLMKTSISKGKNHWTINNPVLEHCVQSASQKIRKKKKPKVLLTYRDLSGSNTYAMYKSIPGYINKNFNVEFVSGNKMSLEYVSKVIESDIIITTNMEYGFEKFEFNPGKIVLDLWHGFPLKNMFYKDPLYSDKNSIAPYWKQFNYLLSYSNLYSEMVNKCIKVDPNKFFVTGAPRNDLLQSNRSREDLFKLLEKEDTGRKIIVYMPTFRASDQRKQYSNLSNVFGFENFNFYEFASFLEENQFELIIKAHPIFARDFENILEDTPFISLIKSEDLMNHSIDFYEILGASDLLLTDYSSVYFDYLLLDKPIIFMPTDLEEYQQERGFILGSYEEWTPGPKVVNQIQLQMEIKEYEKNACEFKKIRECIKNRVHSYQDTNATERVWKFIYELNLSNDNDKD